MASANIGACGSAAPDGIAESPGLSRLSRIVCRIVCLPMTLDDCYSIDPTVDQMVPQLHECGYRPLVDA
jgi:hypothetical protein